MIIIIDVGSQTLINNQVASTQTQPPHETNQKLRAD
jgi:hypothetical protein